MIHNAEAHKGPGIVHLSTTEDKSEHMGTEGTPVQGPLDHLPISSTQTECFGSPLSLFLSFLPISLI